MACMKAINETTTDYKVDNQNYVTTNILLSSIATTQFNCLTVSEILSNTQAYYNNL